MSSDFLTLDAYFHEMYVFDSSSLNHLREFDRKYSDFHKYWDAIEKLIRNNQFFIPLEVYHELNNRIIRTWINPHKDKIVLENDQVYANLHKVLDDYPILKRKNLRKTRPGYHGDPHVIALGMYLDDILPHVKIVADDDRLKKIAGEYDIEAIKFLELLHELGVLK